MSKRQKPNWYDTTKKDKPGWYDALRETPWNAPVLTREQEQRMVQLASAVQGNVGKRGGLVGSAARGNFRKRKMFAPIWITALSLLIILLAITSFGRTDTILDHIGLGGDPSWKARSAAWEGAVKLFEAFPGGDFASGQRNGAWWNLYFPYEQVKGSTLRVDGVHKVSGLEIREIPETTLDDPRLAYDHFTRISSEFDLPMGGLWKFEMYLDDRKLGDVVFDVPEGSWEPSGQFQYETYQLRGSAGKIGVLNTELLRVSLPNKYMWFFWGRTDEETRRLFGKSVTITGTKKGEKDAVLVFQGSTGIPNTDIPNNDNVARVPTSMSLPSAGMWRLDATVDGKYFGSVFLEVRE